MILCLSIVAIFVSRSGPYLDTEYNRLWAYQPIDTDMMWRNAMMYGHVVHLNFFLEFYEDEGPVLVKDSLVKDLATSVSSALASSAAK